MIERLAFERPASAFEVDDWLDFDFDLRQSLSELRGKNPWRASFLCRNSDAHAGEQLAMMPTFISMML